MRVLFAKLKGVDEERAEGEGYLASEVYRWLQARIDAARTEGK
jgi:hypothetical protein